MDGLKLCLLTAATIGPIIYSPGVCGEPRWNISRGKPKNSNKNLTQYHFVHHKSYLNWPGREPGPPWWETGN
jgi:hypothetical protein